MAKTLNDNLVVEVWNNGTGTVSYKIEDKPKRLWDKVDSVKKIQLGELRALVNSAGGYNLLSEDLLIKDIDVRVDLSLPTDAAMLLGKEEIKDLLSKSAVEINSTLESTNEVIKEKIAALAIETKITDTDKMEAIKEHTGVDVYTAIKTEKIEKQEKTTKGSTK